MLHKYSKSYLGHHFENSNFRADRPFIKVVYCLHKDMIKHIQGEVQYDKSQ